MRYNYLREVASKYLLFIFPFLFFLFLSVNSVTALTCSVKNSCGAGETALLKLSGADNAHAELITQTNYGNTICCSEATPGTILGTDCSGNFDVFLILKKPTNSHVEKKTSLNYTNNACISANTGTVACNYSSVDCTAPSTCLARISGDTNAHIGDCAGSSYTTRVCCSYNAGVPPPPPPPPPGSPCSANNSKLYRSPLMVGYCSLEEVIAKASDWVLGTAASLIILILIVGGITYIISAGDPARMKTAKNIIFYAIIGLVMILLSYVLVTTIKEIFKTV